MGCHLLTSARARFRPLLSPRNLKKAGDGYCRLVNYDCHEQICEGAGCGFARNTVILCLLVVAGRWCIYIYIYELCNVISWWICLVWDPGNFSSHRPHQIMQMVRNQAKQESSMLSTCRYHAPGQRQTSHRQWHLQSLWNRKSQNLKCWEV